MNKTNERRPNQVDRLDVAWTKRLRTAYEHLSEEPLPDRFRDLLEELAAVDARRRQR